ncbi:HNH/ENDO VII family nuclease [Actinomyces trachealis]|uniref:HNH/ENDO VII family nuclease n=1 Tax=Actinomyces trachealis TaxID=2763540 RepID=UPI0018C59B9E|nr:HNH/ENDO VII family nuclease [Actinomyces trachealis]
MSIDTSKFPALDLDVETIRTNASDLKTKAGNMRTSGASVKRTWGGMTSCYKAPEQETLYGAMNKVETSSDHLAGKLETIADALSVFADTAAGIKTDSQNLKTRAEAFLVSVASDPDWQYDQGKVDKHDGFLKEANALQVRMWEAERACANKIRALDLLAPYHADKQSAKDNLAYGASTIADRSMGMPWGDPVERKDRCYKKPFVSVWRAVWDDAIMGTINGVTGLFGVQIDNVRFTHPQDPNRIGQFPVTADVDHGWDVLFQSWQPIIGLMGVKWDEYGHLLERKQEYETEAYANIGKGLAHADQWDTDPLRAGLGVVIDVGSLVVPVLGAAKVGKSLSAAGKAGKGLSTARGFSGTAKTAGNSVAKTSNKLTSPHLSHTHARITHTIDPAEQTSKWAKTTKVEAPHLPQGHAHTNPSDLSHPNTPRNQAAEAARPSTTRHPESPNTPHSQAPQPDPKTPTTNTNTKTSPEASTPTHNTTPKANDHQPHTNSTKNETTTDNTTPKTDKTPDQPNHNPTHTQPDNKHTNQHDHPHQHTPDTNHPDTQTEHTNTQETHADSDPEAAYNPPVTKNGPENNWGTYVDENGVAHISPDDPRPYLNPDNRPSFRKGVIEAVWKRALELARKDGYDYVRDPFSDKRIDWNPGEPRNGVWDMGHVPTQQYREVWRKYVNGEMTPKEFRDWYNAPEHYRPELPSSNRSHKAESIP